MQGGSCGSTGAAFTPWTWLAGGLLIGAGAALLVLLSGRVAGWRLAFLAGLIGAPLAGGVFAPLPETRVDAGVPMLLLAGLLVGAGTRYGAGCTSGHGICGLARRSRRSVAASVAFMAAGFITVRLVKHVLEAA